MPTYKLMYKNAVLISLPLSAVIMMIFGLIFLSGVAMIIDYKISMFAFPTAKLTVGRVTISIGLIGFLTGLAIHFMI